MPASQSTVRTVMTTCIGSACAAVTAAVGIGAEVVGPAGMPVGITVCGTKVGAGGRLVAAVPGIGAEVTGAAVVIGPAVLTAPWI